MTEAAIPHGEHKEPKQLIQGGIEGGENTPLRGWKQTLYPQLKQERCWCIPTVERTKKDYSVQIKTLLN